jgi:UDP-2,4-diacetamido-2,4,6-trideoxy-beta-L-altropyranose hydrolase
MRKAISICLRVDGDAASGLGHISRCRSLMAAFSKAGTCRFFVISQNKVMVKKFLEDIKFNFYDMDRAGQRQHFDVLVVDVPHGTAKKEDCLQGLSDILVCIDDAGPGLAFQDILIRPNLLNLSRPKGIMSNNYWSGRDYIILHPDFVSYAYKKRKKTGEVKRIIVCFGGSDPGGLTLRVIPLLKRLKTKAVAQIVLGAAFPFKNRVADRVKNDFRFFIRHNIAHMAQPLRKADVALISGGTLLYEACSLGTPSVVLSQNRGQDMEVKIFHDRGAVVNLGLHKAVSDGKILKTLEQVMNDEVSRKKMSLHGMKIVASDGAARIASKLLSRVKKEVRS